MRSTRLAAFSATRLALTNGPTFPTGGQYNNERTEVVHAFPTNERGIKSSSPFDEPTGSTAVYDGYQAWTYFQPGKVHVEKLAAPEAKYYQRLTKKPWDISSTEWTEINNRKAFFGVWFYIGLIIMAYFILPKEKSYSGLHGPDGFWAFLPKNRPELF